MNVGPTIKIMLGSLVGLDKITLEEAELIYAKLNTRLYGSVVDGISIKEVSDIIKL